MRCLSFASVVIKRLTQLSSIWICVVCLCCLWQPHLGHAHGAYHELLGELEHKIKQSPNDANLIRQRAALHLTHDEWKRALADVERADDLDGQKAVSGWIRGHALREVGNLQAALTALDGYVKQYPKQFEGWQERARVKSALQLDQQAVEDYRKAVRLNQGIELEQVLEWVALEKEAGDIKGVSRALKEGIKRLGEVDALLQMVVEQERQAGHYAMVDQWVKKALANGGDPLYWLARKAEIAEESNDETATKLAWLELKQYLDGLPSLQRGQPRVKSLQEKVNQRVGAQMAVPVIAAPAQN